MRENNDFPKILTKWPSVILRAYLTYFINFLNMTRRPEKYGIQPSLVLIHAHLFYFRLVLWVPPGKLTSFLSKHR